MNAPMTSNSLNHQLQLAVEQWDTISLLVCTTSTSRNGCSSIQEKAFCFSVNLLAIFMEKYHSINQLQENTANRLTHRENVQKLHMEMLPETKAILSEFYHPFNEMLVELTGDRRFHW